MLIHFQEVTEAYIADIFESLNLDKFITKKTAITGKDIKDVATKEKPKNT